jgi:hypothetical protein
MNRSTVDEVVNCTTVTFDNLRSAHITLVVVSIRDYTTVIQSVLQYVDPIAGASQVKLK